MLHVGDKFKVHWAGHEQEYKGRIYRVRSVRSDCTCSLPSWLTGKPEKARKAHCHIESELIDGPIKKYEKYEGRYIFNGIDEKTLFDIERPTFWIEIVREAGDQLSLF